MFIAHRGLYNDDIVENTIRAFDNAFNNGFIGIEFDVRLTKDNVPVIIHDSFISRVTSGKGLVKDFTYDELLKFNLGKNKDKIPTLNMVINKYKNKIMIIELKEKIDIDKYIDNNNNKYYISSFNYNYVKNIPKSTRYKLGIISYIFNPIKDINKIDFIMILDSFSFDSVIESYKKKGVEVIIYGVINNINNYRKDILYVI